MDNLILSFNVVAPLCFVMALGYFLKYLKMFDESTVNVMNNVAFKVDLRSKCRDYTRCSDRKYIAKNAYRLKM